MTPKKSWDNPNKKIVLSYAVIWSISLIGLLVIGLPSSLANLWYPGDKADILRGFLVYVLLVPCGIGLMLLSSFLQGKIRVNPGVAEGMIAAAGFFLIILPPIRYFYLLALSHIVSWEAIMRFIVVVVFVILLLLIAAWVFHDIFSGGKK